MPYTVPPMPLPCNIWHNFDNVTNLYAAPDVATMTNMAYGRRVTAATVSSSLVRQFPVTDFLFVAGLDVRPPTNGGFADLIECPAGSTVFYTVIAVADSGKGFANEHRVAFAFMRTNDATFADAGVVPFPLPIP